MTECEKMMCQPSVVLAHGQDLLCEGRRARREWYRQGAREVIFATVMYVLRQHPGLDYLGHTP